jgi:hypothetical protein
MASSNRSTTFLDDLTAFTLEDRTDLAIELVEINALWAEGEITEDEFATRRAALRADG